MLNNHKDVSVTYDTIHFMRFSYNSYEPITHEDNLQKLLSETKERIQSRYELSYDLNDVRLKIGSKYSYADIYDAIMHEFLLKSTGKTVWGEKTNLAWSRIPDFFHMFPEGRVLHIIRDPRAVLASWKKFTNAKECDYLDSIINTLSTMQKMYQYQAVFAHKRYASIRYEDLVSDSEFCLKQICDKINLNYDEEMLDHEAYRDLKNKPWKPNTIHSMDVKGISTALIDKWTEELSDWEIYLCELVCERYMKIFSYQLASIDVKKIDVDFVVEQITKSKLSNHGLLHYLLTDCGIERYPSDPKDSSTWQKS